MHRLVTRARVRKAAPVAALAALWFVVAAAVGVFAFAHDTEPVPIGAHRTVVSPTFDGYATLDLGPILPRMRLPMEMPLHIGVNLDVQETDASGLSDLITRDALIASQPDGEIHRIRTVVRQMAVDSAIAGAGAGFLAVVLAVTLWAMFGERRRRELVDVLHKDEHAVERRALVILLAMAITTAAVVVPGIVRRPEVDPTEWRPLVELLPELEVDDRLRNVEVATGFSTTGGIGLFRTAAETYEKSTRLYGDLKAKVTRASSRIRQPGPEETVAMVVSDRHDNIGMDPVIAEVAKAAGAKVLIDAGDDTSSGQRWEAFSINSLAQHFRDLKVVAVAGNHDAGGFVEDAMKANGFTVLDSKPVEVEGIRFFGDSDPTRTGLGSSDSPGKETIEEQSNRLADVACSNEDPISTMVVHDPNSGAETARRGCATLVISGHLHRQVGPQSSEINGRMVTTYTNGTTGGAAYAFALGYTLRRSAQVTLITYEGGEPIGLQTVMFETSGEVMIGSYRPIGRL